jgi:sortase B
MGYDTRNKTKGEKYNIIKFLVPQKGDNKGELARKIVLLAAIAAILVFAVIITINELQNAAQNHRNKELLKLKEDGSLSISVEKDEQIREQKPGILDKYLKLYEQNPDIVGWIRIDKTPIDYPVMQSSEGSPDSMKGSNTKDPETQKGQYYLYRLFDKSYNKVGSIFADYHNKFTALKRPDNTILYGHNIANGTMFAKVAHYYPKLSGGLQYYINRPTITFDTVYKEGTYKIFAGIFTNTDEKHGKVYPYYQKTTFKNKSQFYDFCTNILDRSSFYTDVDLKYGDEILTLSTCYYPLGESVDTRFALFARRVRDGEDPNVDTSKATVNTSPLYFDYYYKVNGGKWAGRLWDTSKVEGLDKWLETHEVDGIPASKGTAETTPADNTPTEPPVGN